MESKQVMATVGNQTMNRPPLSPIQTTVQILNRPRPADDTALITELKRWQTDLLLSVPFPGYQVALLDKAIAALSNLSS